MTLFYFDTNDGNRDVRDDEGLELPDRIAARLAAIDALPDMARDAIPDGDQRTLTVKVRDAGGNHVYVATLNLTGMWLDRVAPRSTAPATDPARVSDGGVPPPSFTVNPEHRSPGQTVNPPQRRLLINHRPPNVCAWLRIVTDAAIKQCRTRWNRLAIARQQDCSSF